jgi:hypothetical protein
VAKCDFRTDDVEASDEIPFAGVGGTVASERPALPPGDTGWVIIGILKCSERNLPQCHFVDHNSHIDYPGSRLGPLRLEASDCPLELPQSLGREYKEC